MDLKIGLSVKNNYLKQPKKNNSVYCKTETSKKIKKNNCVSCKSETSKKYCNDCKKFIQYTKLFKKLNIDSSLSLHNQSIITKKILIDLYFTQKLSLEDIKQKFGIMYNTIHFFLKKFNISLRTLSQSQQLSIEQGKIILPTNKKYKHGWHTTWNNKRVYYRSSYELNYCFELDNKKIDYSMETVRIKYYDSQKKKNRIAIPDFLIGNSIVEIKSTYTYDPINIKDKFIAYKNLGYDVKLFVDNVEIIL